jgi:phosphoribosylglycinamide formyltransferase 1
MTTRVGILISGRGSNMLALAAAVRAGRVPGAEIVVVISDHAEAAGLSRGSELGLTTAIVEREGRSREDHDRAIVSELQSHGVAIVCLAGYMRLLSKCFIDAYRGRILNIHPSLLPAFPGLAAHQQVLEHGVKWTGCSVHFVDESLDGGPIIAQQVVPVLDDDTEEILAARILEQEHSLYPEALAVVVSGDYEIVGRRVIRKS